jgi:hypothetical protein
MRPSVVFWFVYKQCCLFFRNLLPPPLKKHKLSKQNTNVTRTYVSVSISVSVSVSCRPLRDGSHPAAVPVNDRRRRGRLQGPGAELRVGAAAGHGPPPTAGL